MKNPKLTPDQLMKQAQEYALNWDRLANKNDLPEFFHISPLDADQIEEIFLRLSLLEERKVHFLFPNADPTQRMVLEMFATCREAVKQGVLCNDEKTMTRTEQAFVDLGNKIRGFLDKLLPEQQEVLNKYYFPNPLADKGMTTVFKLRPPLV